MKQPNDTKRPNCHSRSLSQFLRSRERMTHVAKAFIPNPLKAAAELAGMPFDGPEFVALQGNTYNAGRNAAKRERRAA